MQTIPKITFGQALKSPPVYIMMVAISIAWFFVYQFTDSSKETIENLKQTISNERNEKAALKSEIKEKDQVIDSLNGLMLHRADNSYEKLEKYLQLNNKQSTIIIKPKKK